MKNKNRVKAWSYTDQYGTHATTGGIPDVDIPCEIVFNNGWIKRSERKPAKKDADKYGNIHAWSRQWQSCVKIFWRDFTLLNYEYWQPCPKGPKKIK